MRLPALSQPAVPGHTCNTHTERRGGGWLKQQIPSLFPWLREVVSGVAVGRSKSACWTGFVMWGIRAWERLADPTHPISLPLARKLQGNHFLAAFPPPLWFIAARRLCMWRWHKSHLKERERRRKFAFAPLLAYWMQLSSSLLKPWAGPGQEAQALPSGLNTVSAGAPCPTREGSHSQQGATTPTQPNYTYINFNLLIFIFHSITLPNLVMFAGFEHLLCSPLPTTASPFNRSFLTCGCPSS